MILRPMLAARTPDLVQLGQIQFPVLCTPKLDGLRCVKTDSRALTRTFKNVPNLFVRNCIEDLIPDGCDGEIMLPNRSFNSIQSEIMSHEGIPDFRYCIFDYVKDSVNKPYSERVKDLDAIWNLNRPDWVSLIIPVLATKLEELFALEQKYIDAGYEGLIFRSPDSPYKAGRSTLKQGWMVKLKRYVDAEAKVIGFEELQHNENEKEESEIGLSKRSSHSANLVSGNTLGALCVQDDGGRTFRVGTGFTQAERKEIWDNKEKYLGEILTYKSMPYGMKDLPRHPVFKGWRKD